MIVTMQVGKKGLTEEQVNEIKRQLGRKRIVRIKLLSSAIENEEKEKFFDEIIEKTNSNIVKKIGNTLIIKKSI